ncbi:MAG: MerC domain-containing protein [Planctomycetes bacterium]|nr:MerC domain-containing protein [Planctomycetota bacterium]
MMRIRLNLDALGVCASTLCMIHCLVLPLLLAALPLWSLSGNDHVSNAATPLAASSSTAAYCVDGECRSEQVIAASDAQGGEEACAACCSTPLDFWIHVGLLATVAPLGLVAWGVGYRHHRRLGVLALGAFGVLLLASALLFGTQLFGGRGEQVLTVTGSICMVSAHLWNRRQCRCCRTPDLARLVEIESASSVTAQLPITDGGVS